MQYVAWTVCALLMATFVMGCANPGAGPDGGPYDETPPRVVEMHPLLGKTNVKKGKKIEIKFSEAVKVENPSENIIISPPQIQMPEIKLRGKRIVLELLDTLKRNTTYTVDFSDAIKDVTEGNPLGNFTYYFSTGEEVDTMEMSGYVLDAETLEPVKGILVGLHANMSDTAFADLPLLRVGKTDQEGHFSIKGVAMGDYHIFALQDRDGDVKYSRGEMMAFSDSVLRPSCFADVRYDTSWVDTIRYDTVYVRDYTHFMPDDVLLRAFKPVRTFHSLLKIERPTPEKFTAYFTAPNDSLPLLEGLNFRAKNAFLVEASAQLDTITYWIKDKGVRENDSLRLTYRYEQTNDSTQVTEMKTDTLELVPKLTNAKLRKFAEMDSVKWAKEVKKRHKKGDFTKDEPPVKPLKVEEKWRGNITPLENLWFETQEPVVRLDTAGVHLDLKVDSVMVEAKYKLVREGWRRWKVMAEWRPGQEYEVRIDSGAVEGLLGLTNFELKQKVNVEKEEEMGSVFVQMPDAPEGTLVQLLKNDKEVLHQLVLKEGHADFYYLKPGKVYLRCVFDRNHNGRWDTGDYAKNLQPEEVYYLNVPIEVRANWDVNQTWVIEDVPVRLQKPKDLRLNKEGKQRKQTGHERNVKRMQEKEKQRKKNRKKVEEAVKAQSQPMKVKPEGK